MKTVLLVEDDLRIALALGVRLKAMGYKVHTARDAVAAVSQVRSLAPDVVLLDISLPDGDGLEAAESILKLDESAATPVILITTSKAPGQRERAVQLGAARFLNKPFDAAQLADAIEAALFPDPDWQPQRWH
jgi:CheY-like chemotaxis protein